MAEAATVEQKVFQIDKSKTLIYKIANKYGVDPDKFLTTLKQTVFRQKEGDVTNEQMMMLLVVADQYDLNPFTGELRAFPDKSGGIVPVVTIDGWTKIINAHQQFASIEFEYGPPLVKSIDIRHKDAVQWIKCSIHRRDRDRPISLIEFFDEVYRPAHKRQGSNGEYFIDSPWQTHTKRMHRHKAMIQCARIAFGFSGIYDEDEAMRIVDADSQLPRTAEQSEAIERINKLIENQSAQVIPAIKVQEQAELAPRTSHASNLQETVVASLPDPQAIEALVTDWISAIQSSSDHESLDESVKRCALALAEKTTEAQDNKIFAAIDIAQKRIGNK